MHDRNDILVQSLHTEVLEPLYVLLAIALELPEDYFNNLHRYDVKSEVSATLRFSYLSLTYVSLGSLTIHEVHQVHS